MSAGLTFTYGLFLLFLFGWYFAADSDRTKRILGTVLTVLLTALCLQAVYPPADVLDEKGNVVRPGKLLLGLDLQGGTSFLIKIVSEPDPVTKEKKEITPKMVDQAVEVIRKRVDAFGTSEPVITPQGTDRILVQIPKLDTAKLQEVREQLQKVAKLEFRKVHPMSRQILAGQAPPDPAYVKLPMKREKLKADGKPDENAPLEHIMVRRTVDLEGKHVIRAGASFQSMGYAVHLAFDGVGGEKFGKLTEEVFNEQTQLAIVLDGEVISAPGVTKGAIYGGSCEITGSFSETEAMNLASALENPLENPVTIEEERSASASLGADAIKSGVLSGLIGVALTIVGVLLYYRFAGVVANIALAVNMILLLGIMAMFNTVLTLPGIAGIILTLGMAIDANVLIYERLREEMDAGKALKPALDSAFEKAFTAIFDSNVTTLITAVILFWKATGPVKGFAVTLTIGIIASLFTALVVTRNLFSWALHLGWIKRITMTNLIKATNFDFLGRRRAAVTLSLAVIIGSMAIFALRGDKNFGVDFKGGDRLVLEATQQKPALGDVRGAIENDLKITDSIVNIEKSAQKEFYTIRAPEGSRQKISDHLQTRFPNAGFRVEQSEKVGSLVGGELATNSLIALGLGMLGILFYVTLRFEFAFALGALVALLHDVIITVGVFALLGRELSLVIVGAVLTIAGYSVNDTIVVFDRIREGIQAGRKGSVMDIMNQSINETLSRTILTGGVTLLTTAALFLFGGPVLNDFALTILVGVLVGTYSSVFIAAPIVLWWSGKGGHSLRQEIVRAEEAKAAAKA